MELFNYLLWIAWAGMMIIYVITSWKIGFWTSALTWFVGVAGMTAAMAYHNVGLFIGVGIVWCVFEPVAVIYDNRESTPATAHVIASLIFLFVTACVYAGVDYTSSQLAAAAAASL